MKTRKQIYSLFAATLVAGILPAAAQDYPAVPHGNNPGELRPHAWIRVHDAGAHPNAVTGMPSGLWPSDINQAYGLIPGGSGVTVAIVDAYDSPNAEADLATFSSQFGLAPCTTANGCFKKVNQNGLTVLPKRNSGWEVEINLDTQWVHAVAPYAKILLVEANSSSNSDLLSAVNYAKAHASIVSMSWGGSESYFQTFYDSMFVAPGVTFLASSGDTGGIVEWPASSPYVIGVGGTNLALNASTGRVAIPVQETGWSGSGGGCSTVESKPAAQSGFVPSTCLHRGSPDVSMNGGGSSAVAVVVSLQGGWYDVYGTSLSVQLYAGMLALAESARGGALSSTLADLYQAGAATKYSTDFRDITVGTAGKNTAGPGWDFVTGLGSPKAALVAFLASQSSR